MKKLIIYFLPIIALLSCETEEPIKEAAETNETQWVRFNEPPPFPHNVIYNPKREQALSGDTGSKIYYINIDGISFTRLQVEDSYGSYDTSFAANNKVEGYGRTVKISVDGIVAYNIEDNKICTYKPLFPDSIKGDSAYILSHQSSIVSPLTDTSWVRNFSRTIPQWFDASDSINLFDRDLLTIAQKNQVFWTSSDLELFKESYRERFYKNHPNGPYFRVEHEIFKNWLGKERKIVVFRWYNGHPIHEYYYGWMEISLSLTGQFEIHKVVYQTD